ncbi:MAG: ABC transporter substrate-binding protein [Oscillospiraceae bacterium]
MKKLLSVFLAATMVVTCFAGCGKKEEGQGGAAAAPEGTQTLVIGGSGPLTGDNATYGISVKQGAMLAAKEINAAGGANGTMLEVKFEDDQADPAMAVNAYATLYDAGMQVSMGATTSAACISMSEEANKDGMLMVTPSASQKEAIKYDNAFRICFTDPDQGIYAANFIAEKKIAKKAAMIYDKSNDYSAGIAKNFEEQAAKVGIEVATKQAFTDQSNTDFTVQLEAIKAADVELLFMPIYAQQAAYVLTQAKKIGLEVIFFGCDGLDGILEKIGADNMAATEGVMLLTPFAADAKDAKTAAFVSAYKTDYKTTPDQFAADGYDAVYTIAEAFKASGITDLKDKEFDAKMIAAMLKITVEGTTGKMTWSKDGEPAKSATAVKIVNGGYVAY